MTQTLWVELGSAGIRMRDGRHSSSQSLPFVLSLPPLSSSSWWQFTFSDVFISQHASAGSCASQVICANFVTMPIQSQ